MNLFCTHGKYRGWDCPSCMPICKACGMEFMRHQITEAGVCGRCFSLSVATRLKIQIETVKRRSEHAK